MGTINIVGTGGIIEGNLGAANVNVNLDALYDLDGSDDFFYAADNAAFDLSAGFTLSAWIKPTGDSSEAWQIVMAKNGTAGGDANRPYAMWYHQATQRIYLYLGNNSTSVQLGTDADTIIPNVWQHVAISFQDSSDTARIYYNGKQVKVGTSLNITPHNTSQSFSIGANYDNDSSRGEEFKGQIADVKLYSTILTDATILALSSKIYRDPQLLEDYASLKAWYKLNNSTADSKGSLTLTASGSPAADYDAFSVDVYDNSTTTDGTFTVTQGKVEGKALSHLTFDGSNDYAVTSDDTVIIDDVDSTIAFWYKGASPGSGKTIMESRATANDGLIYTRNGTELRYYTSASGEFGLDASEVTACGLYDDEWHHVAFVLDHGGNLAAQKVYVDGVSRTLTEISTVSLDVTWRGFKVGGQLGHINAELRDIKVFDYPLSADQASSLYSNTYPQTAKHYWKFDEGTGTSAEDSGTATDQDLTINGATYVNGTLDLDGKFETAANGTLSAPRGKVQVAGDFEPAGSWIHNNGTLETNNTSEKDFNVDASTALYNWIHDGATLTIENATDGHIVIENALTINSSKNLKFQDGADLTFGTSTQAATVTNNGNFENRNANNTVTLRGASSLYPFAYEGTDINWDQDASSGNVQNYILSNCNWNPDITTGEYVNIQLAGDCEFDAFTVSANSTLDLNGQRVEFGGNVTYEGTIDADGLLVFHGGFTKYGTLNNAASGDIMTMGTSGFPTFSYITGYRTFFANGGVQLGTGGFTSIPTAIIASGELKTGTRNCSATNLTIATGGEFEASANTHTVSGDFTTSGGLLGASAIDLNGSDEYVASAVYNDDRSVNDSADYTIELWFKRTETSGTETLFDLAHTSDSGSSFTGQSRSSAYMDANGVIYWDTRTGGGTLHARPQSSAGFDDSKWHHAAFVFKGSAGAHTGTYSTGAKEIWVDGKLEARVLGGDTTTDAGSSVASSMGYDQNKTVIFNVGRTVVSGVQSFFTGNIDEIRMWSDARTQAEIRDNMFSEVAVDSANLRHQYSFNEGTGSAVEDTATSTTGEAHLEVDLVTYDGSGAATDLWAGEGTFDFGTSTLKMTGSNKSINFTSDEHLYNLHITGTISLNEIRGLAKELRLEGQAFTVGSGATLSSTNVTELTFRPAFDGGTISLADPATNIANIYKIFCNGSGALSLPELTTKRVVLDRNGGNVTATGNHTFTEELELNSGTTYNANGNTINTKKLDTKSGSTTDLRNSNLTFKVTTSGDSMSIDPSSTILSGNTLVEGYSVSSPTTLSVNSTGGIEIVGDVKFMRMQSGGDLTVIGSVVGCIFDDSTGNIRQFFHTLDTQQLLDADEAGDDDLRLEKPTLDNANELQTG